jgi:lipoyl(octanoyl) transferase
VEAWRLLTTWDAEPGFNMALDEALLSSAPLSSGECRPTLRVYSWKPDALSLGYFQRFDEVAGKSEAGALVRRLTGGGAIHHRRELTFSIVAPLDHPLYRGEVRGSYERIHRAIAAALRRVGVRADLRGEGEVTSDDEASGMCFHHSTPFDLVWAGAKGVGSAQRRRNGRVLHHGSIKIGSTPLEGPIAVLPSEAGITRPEELAALLLEVFGERWSARFSSEEPSDGEIDQAHRRAEFFRSEEFLRRR